MSVNIGDWVMFRYAPAFWSTYERIEQVKFIGDDHVITTSGIEVHRSRIIESRPPQGEAKEQK